MQQPVRHRPQPLRLEPTVGLVSRAGVVPISHTQDTVGPHARTVADAAAVLTAIVSRIADPRDPATATSPLGKAGQPRPTLPADYTQFVNPDGLRGARVGVAREFEGFSPKLDVVFEDALAAMRSAGATLVDVTFPHFQDIFNGTPEFTVLLFEFKGDLQDYLATRVGAPLAGGTLADAITFNRAHAAQELKISWPKNCSSWAACARLKVMASARRSSSSPSCSMWPTQTPAISRSGFRTTTRWRPTSCSAPRKASICCSRGTTSTRSSPRPTTRPGRRT